jgi:hypothetical protein
MDLIYEFKVATTVPAANGLRKSTLNYAGSLPMLSVAALPDAMYVKND